MALSQPTTALPSGSSPTSTAKVKRKGGRPVGSGTPHKLTPEEALEYSSQRMSHGFLLVSDLQRLLGRGDQWVKDQINTGRLPAKRLGHEYITTWEAVLKFIDGLPSAADKKPRQPGQRTKTSSSAALPTA